MYIDPHTHTHTYIYAHKCTYIYTDLYIHTYQAAVVLILLYGCTTWTLTKCIEKKA